MYTIVCKQCGVVKIYIYTNDKFKHIATPDNQKILWVHMVQIFNRPCDAGAVLQSPPSLIDLF